jgi:hypothetical protein
MDQRIPEPIRPVLGNYISRVRQQLPGLPSAFYVVGSIALDGYIFRYSDIDFVAFINHKKEIIMAEISMLLKQCEDEIEDALWSLEVPGEIEKALEIYRFRGACLPGTATGIILLPDAPGQPLEANGAATGRLNVEPTGDHGGACLG